jgi:hypothetical protein
MKRWMVVLAAIACVGPFAHAVDKDSYVKKTERDLKEWSAKVETLQKKAETAGQQSRAEFDRDVAIIRQKIDTAQSKLTEIEQSNQSTWKSLRKGADEAIGDVKKAYKNATSSIKKSEHKESKP